MSRKLVGEKAMTGTERSRRRLQREAEHLAMLRETLKDSAQGLLMAAKVLADLGQTITAQDCIAMAEKAMNAAKGEPGAAPVVAEVEDPQKKFQRLRAERRPIIHNRYAGLAKGA